DGGDRLVVRLGGRLARDLLQAVVRRLVLLRHQRDAALPRGDADEGSVRLDQDRDGVTRCDDPLRVGGDGDLAVVGGDGAGRRGRRRGASGGAAVRGTPATAT